MVTEPLSTPNNLVSLGDLSDLNNDKGQQFLQFQLLPDTTVLLPLAQMAEVLSVPVMQIVPIPNLPEWVMGIYNWQGQIIWLVDLGRLIGLAPIYEQGTGNYTAIVIRQIGTSNELGLLVHRVEDIEWVNPDLIESPPASEIRPRLLPFLRGFLAGNNNQTNNQMVVLDSDSIFAAMPQQESEA
jgi:positive phototaxis protein PixI